MKKVTFAKNTSYDWLIIIFWVHEKAGVKNKVMSLFERNLTNFSNVCGVSQNREKKNNQRY